MFQSVCATPWSSEIVDAYGGNKALRFVSQVLNPSASITISPSWPEVLSVSQKEGLSFLLYKGMIKRNIDMPSPIREQLKKEYINNWGRNVRILEEFAALLRILENPIIILKGAALLSSVYEDFGIRGLGDIDILVKPAEVPNFDKVLSQLGYRSFVRLHSFRVSNCYNSQLYRKKGSPLFLHLHWHWVNDALPNYIYAEKINADKLWKEAMPLKIRQADALCLALHHQLLHLSEHATRHSYNLLIHVWDIHQVINHWKEKLDWEILCREAEEFHLRRPLFYSLWLSKEYFGTCVPNEILETLHPRREGLGERIFSRLLRQGKRKENLCYFFYFSNISGWQKRIRFIFRAIVPTREVIARMEGVGQGRQSTLYLRVALRKFRRILRFFSKD